MKKSEQIIKEAEMSDNDMKAFGLYKKAAREKRYEKFVEEYLPDLLGKGIAEESSHGKFNIAPTPYGIVDFFPKSNRLLIRRENHWINNGIEWLKKYNVI